MDRDDELDARMVGEGFCDVPLIRTGLVLPEPEIGSSGVHFSRGFKRVQREPVSCAGFVEPGSREDHGLDASGRHV